LRRVSATFGHVSDGFYRRATCFGASEERRRAFVASWMLRGADNGSNAVSAATGATRQRRQQVVHREPWCSAYATMRKRGFGIQSVAMFIALAQAKWGRWLCLIPCPYWEAALLRCKQQHGCMDWVLSWTCGLFICLPHVGFVRMFVALFVVLRAVCASSLSRNLLHLFSVHGDARSSRVYCTSSLVCRLPAPVCCKVLQSVRVCTCALASV
jgi:hypothetical protein